MRFVFIAKSLRTAKRYDWSFVPRFATGMH